MFCTHLFIFCMGFYLGVVGGDESYFWQITDIHWDWKYSRFGDTSKMCTETKGKEVNFVSAKIDNGYFGNHRCDSPFSLVVSAIEAMANFQPNPDFILWTGDMLPHRTDLSKSDIFPLLKNVTDLLISHFPNVTIIPVFGNHEVVPKDQLPSDNPSFYPEYLSKTAWDLVIPPDGVCGYYSVRVKPRLHVLALNTILYKINNNEVSEDEQDPAGQFEWMMTKLQNARDEREKVIITAHCPPGYKVTLKEKFNDRYVDLMLEFSDVVVTHVYGHRHRDLFQLFINHKFEVLGYSLVAPSVTPWGLGRRSNANNPSIRQYKYDVNHYLITDYYQYVLNLSLANEKYGQIGQRPDQWVLSYRFTTEYNTRNLTVWSMLKHFNNLKTDHATFEKFNKHCYADYKPLPCDAKCKLDFVCSCGFLKRNLLERCFKDNGTTVLTLASSGATSQVSKLLTIYPVIANLLLYYLFGFCNSSIKLCIIGAHELTLSVYTKI